MKLRLTRPILFILQFFFFITGLHAQDWQQMGSLQGSENVTVQSNEEGYVFASLSGFQKIYRKHKDEDEWQPLAIPEQLDFNNVTLGAGANLYLYDFMEFEWWMSPDNGDSWQMMTDPLPGYQVDLIVDLGGGKMLSSDGYRVHKSNNGGQSWQEVISVVQSFGFIKMVVDPISGAIYLPAPTASTGSIILRSFDEGDHWEAIIYDGQFHDFNLHPVTGEMMIATHEGILTSNDDGVTWVAYGTPPNPNAAAPSVRSFVFTQTGRVVALKTPSTLESSVFFSDDDGQSWTAVLNEESYQMKNLHLTKHGELFGYRQGIVSSQDAGLNWSLDMQGINHGLVYDYCENTDGVAFAASNSGIFRSTDNRASWEMIHRNPTNILPEIEMNEAGDLYILYDKRLLISSDNGNSFIQLDAPEVNPVPNQNATYPKFKLHPSGALFSLHIFKIYRSLDNGISWSESTLPFNCAGLMIDDDGNMAAHNNNLVAHSTDIGETWDTNSLPDFNINVSNSFYLLKDGGMVYIYGNSPSQIYSSADFGATWSVADCANCYTWSLSNHCVTEENYIFSRADIGQVRFSIDRGASWNLLPYLPEGNASRVFYTPTKKLLTSTNQGGLYQYDPIFTTVSGVLKKETDTDCVIAPQDSPMEGWKIAATGDGHTYYGFSDEQGRFLMPTSVGDFTIRAVPPNNLWEACETDITLTTQNLYTEFPLGDIGVHAKELCPYLTVDVTTNILRRCFESSFTVKYSNTGTAKAEGAYVELVIDPYLEITASSIPVVNQNGPVFTFFLGNIEVNKSGSFKVEFNVSCDAELGQWHCVEAAIFPNDICGENADWSGSVIDVQGICEGDGTLFTVTNSGAGNMQEAVAYEIFDATGLIETGEFQLNAAESKTFLVEATGWAFFKTTDEPGYPFPGQPSAFVDACDGQTSDDATWPHTLLHLGDSEPFNASFCQQNRGAYDPNDKTAFPAGYGGEHLLEANIPIDYLIRFQNTGTDTAFTVVVVDTLAEWLDPASLELGAGSHPYTFEMSGSREDGGVILKFIFENIMLPDSNINEVASHGFVKFHISQMPDNPIGTRIENSAAIYFDFNEPIITNTAWHIIGEDFFPTVNSTNAKWQPQVSLDMAPNPYSIATVIKLTGVDPGDFKIKIFDLTGRVLLEDSFSQNQYTLDQESLPNGVLTVGIYQNNLPVVFDKLVKVGR